MSSPEPEVQTGGKKTAPKVKPPTQKELLNQRLIKIETALERLAANQQPAPASSPLPVQPERPSRIDIGPHSNITRSVSLDAVNRQPLYDFSHTSFVENASAGTPAPPFLRPRNQTRAPSGRDVRPNVETATRPTDPASAWNAPPQQRPDPIPSVNNNNHWEAWLSAPAQRDGAFRPPVPQDMHRAPMDATHVESQVQQILASTAHSLSRGTVKFDYPFKYISRGAEKKKLSLNQVTLAEHLWGILRMVKDEKTDPSLIRPLLAHLEDVIEDSCDFEWARVRRWSEEVFCLVSEKRLPEGWASATKIQMLRMSMARLEVNMFQQHKDQPARRQQTYQNYQSQAPEPPKGGPPCQAYNSPAGCSLPAGHFTNGRRMSHVCSFCLVNSSAAYTHPEAQCRNKIRFPPPHF